MPVFHWGRMGGGEEEGEGEGAMQVAGWHPCVVIWLLLASLGGRPAFSSLLPVTYTHMLQGNPLHSIIIKQPHLQRSLSL